jgi:hypothetical protein
MSYLNSPSPPFSFIPSIPGLVSTGINFSVNKYVYIVFAPYSPSFSHLLPLLIGRTCFVLLFSDFLKEKQKKKK